MKKYVSTIIFISIIVISVLMGVRQYKNDESLKSKENEPQTEVSWATPWGKATMKKVADLNETESYDTTKSFYKDYDDTGLETCILTGIFADSEEEAIKQVRETGHCRYAYLTEDGKCEIKLTEEEKTWWIDSAKKTVDKIIEKNVDAKIFDEKKLIARKPLAIEDYKKNKNRFIKIKVGKVNLCLDKKLKFFVEERL